MQTWTMREIVVAAAIAVVFGVLFMAFNAFYSVVAAVTADYAGDILFGLWCLPAVVAAYVIRKPGAAFFAEMVAAFVEVAFGAPWGLPLLITGLTQGLGVELPFALTRWRRYDWSVIIASGITVGLVTFGYKYFSSSYGTLSAGVVVSKLVLRLASGILLSGVLGRFIGEALYRTGVLNGLAIDERRVVAP